MTTIPAPPQALSQAGRAAHDIGLAGLLGGSLFGRMAFHPAVANISDPRERGEVINAAWRRYGTVNSASLVAVVAGWAGARARRGADRNLTPAERRLARVKDGLVGALVVSGRRARSRASALRADGAGRRRAADGRLARRRRRRRTPRRGGSGA